jgi:hypothetical protein
MKDSHVYTSEAAYLTYTTASIHIYRAKRSLVNNETKKQMFKIRIRTQESFDTARTQLTEKDNVSSAAP